MIFSILQVSRDRKRLLTASVWHLSSVVYCKKVTVLSWNSEAHVRDHSIQPWFVSYKNVG